MSTILLVEDDFDLRGIITVMLHEVYGYDVTSVPSGHEGYAVFLGNPSAFDLILSDFHMLGMDGNTLRNRVNSHCDDEGIPRPAFLIMSGAWSPAVGGDNDGVQFIAKPFEGQNLHAKIQQLLEGRKVV